METRITATELVRSLSDILSRVQDQGESFLIERNGHAVATLAPAEPKPRTTVRELFTKLRDEGLIPVDDKWADDLEKIQKSQSRTPPPKWDS